MIEGIIYAKSHADWEFKEHQRHLEKIQKINRALKDLFSEEDRFLTLDYNELRDMFGSFEYKENQTEQEKEQDIIYKNTRIKHILKKFQQDFHNVERIHRILKIKIHDWKGDIEQELQQENNKPEAEQEFYKINELSNKLEIILKINAECEESYINYEALSKSIIETLHTYTKKLRLDLDDYNYVRRSAMTLMKIISELIRLHKEMNPVIYSLENLIKKINPTSEQLQNYKALTSHEKINDLLQGVGQFSKNRYTFEQRRDIWNRWARSTHNKFIHKLNCTGINLSGFYFEKFQFEYCNLNNANFSGADLTNAKFIFGNYLNANFMNSKLNKAEFHHTMIQNFIFDNNTDFRGSNINNSWLTYFDHAVHVNENNNRLVINRLQFLTFIKMLPVESK